ncbi:MAG: M67 family metallopeptidase [Nitrospinae bacterium]|nr:M67 family metallopeptidase [Nitrospinota bacterium]
MTFTAQQIAQMRSHALEAYPRECIGAIVGADPANAELIPLTNVQDQVHREDPRRFTRDARTGYFVDPKEVFTLVSKAQKEGKKLLAFYHSHPDHECYFSQEDHAGAVMFGEPVYPDTVYIVISVCQGAVKDAVIFSWNGATYTPSGNLRD